MNNRAFFMSSYFRLYCFYSEHLPKEGETLTGNRYYITGGGKGINQAFAAARDGTEVQMIGRMGDDDSGRQFARECAACGIGTDCIYYDPDHSTGAGVILRDDNGDNQIVIVPAALDALAPADIDRAEDCIRSCAIGSFQFEANNETVLYAIRRAAEWGVQTFLDPAPAAPIPEEFYPYMDYIKPNEHEASVITGIEVTDEKSAEEAGKWLIARGVKRAAIITLGENGCVVVTPEGVKHYPRAPAEVEDVTCAGDSFAGAFVSAIARGEDLEHAVINATEWAAVTVSVRGSIGDAFETCLPIYETVHRNYQKLLAER